MVVVSKNASKQEIREKLAAKYYEEFMTAFGQLEWDERNNILNLAIPHIFLKVDKSVSSVDIGHSKYGGRPDMAPEIVWPLKKDGTPFAFLFQINLDRTVHFDIEEVLPTSGMLSFFISYTAPGKPLDQFPPQDNFRVIYSPDTSVVERKDNPFNAVMPFMYEELKIVPRMFYSLPHVDSYKLEGANISMQDMNNMRHLAKEHSHGVKDFMLGQPNNFVDCPYTGWSKTDPAANKLKGVKKEEFIQENKSEFINLAEFNMGQFPYSSFAQNQNEGVIHWGIKKNDLKKGNFDKVIVTVSREKVVETS